MKGVMKGYPLAIEAKDIKVCEVEFNNDFITHVIPKLKWSELVEAAEQLGQLGDLPTELPDYYENDTEFLKQAHHVLLEIEVINADLVCPESGRKYPVNDGIPNMLLNEDEI